MSGASVMSVSTAPHLGSAETLIDLELKIACDTKRAHEQQQQAHKERVQIPSTIIFIAWWKISPRRLVVIFALATVRLPLVSS